MRTYIHTYKYILQLNIQFHFIKKKVTKMQRFTRFFDLLLAVLSLTLLHISYYFQCLHLYALLCYALCMSNYLCMVCTKVYVSKYSIYSVFMKGVNFAIKIRSIEMSTMLCNKGIITTTPTPTTRRTI